MQQKIPFLLIVACFFTAIGCRQKAAPQPSFTINGMPAPELNSGYGWLNSSQSYSLKNFRGKIVLLDFWTLGCINCQHVIPEIKRLEDSFPKELVVVGIHSAKFQSEKQDQRIKDAIVKFGIDHPVLNDADYQVWNAYGVESWPTLVLITPDGKIAKKTEGEDAYETLRSSIRQLAEQYAGQLNNTPFVFSTREQADSTSVLKFPSKLMADENGDIWLSDSGHDRILKIDKTGKILTVIGSGKKGLANGPFANASFNEPQGLAVKNNILYIADAKNNVIRAANLANGQVSTLAGNGEMGYYYDNEKRNEPVLPNSPWDLLIVNNDLYIADAGNHQLLKMNLADNKVFRFAGTGEEGIQDSVIEQASFSQPSGLARQGDILYVADPEASAIRQLNLKTRSVKTIIGKGLFEFGDKDGQAAAAQLQHCSGLAESKGVLYIADTYNGKVKALSLKNNIVRTLVTGLDEPNGLLVLGDELWVTDTNHQQLVKYNLQKGGKELVKVRL